MKTKTSRNDAHQGVIQRLMDAEKEAREQVKKAVAEADDLIESAKPEAWNQPLFPGIETPFGISNPAWKRKNGKRS